MSSNRDLTGFCGIEYGKISCCGVPSRFALKRSVRGLYSLRQLCKVFHWVQMVESPKGVDFSLVSLFFGLYQYLLSIIATDILTTLATQ